MYTTHRFQHILCDYYICCKKRSVIIIAVFSITNQLVALSYLHTCMLYPWHAIMKCWLHFICSNLPGSGNAAVLSNSTGEYMDLQVDYWYTSLKPESSDREKDKKDKRDTSSKCSLKTAFRWAFFPVVPCTKLYQSLSHIYMCKQHDKMYAYIKTLMLTKKTKITKKKRKKECLVPCKERFS